MGEDRTSEIEPTDSEIALVVLHRLGRDVGRTGDAGPHVGADDLAGAATP